jgi:hypothetical protein
VSSQSSRDAHGHVPGHSHGHAGSVAAAAAHSHDREAAPAAGAARVVASPLWWSAPQRLACAVLLAAVLWLVIGWAVA